MGKALSLFQQKQFYQSKNLGSMLWAWAFLYSEENRNLIETNETVYRTKEEEITWQALKRIIGELKTEALNHPSIFPL